jgi:AcrR family transcriptional regulator
VATHGSQAARGAHQLPPGRHGLSRSFVARNQRERILAAVGEEVSAKGYPEVSVADIVNRAGVSRRTFYELFDNKEEAFLAAYDEAAGRLVSSVRAAYAAETGFTARFGAGFQVFLELLAASPAFARMCIVEVLAAGPEAVERRRQVMAEFARLIEENARDHLEPPAPPPLVAETVVGGICEAVYRRIAAGETELLPRLVPDFVESALLPYVGASEAAAYRARLDGGGDAVAAGG